MYVRCFLLDCPLVVVQFAVFSRDDGLLLASCFGVIFLDDCPLATVCDCDAMSFACCLDVAWSRVVLLFVHNHCLVHLRAC